MPAWGMSNAGKEAEGWPREMGAWSADQMRQWLARQNRYSDLSDFYTGGAADYWTQRRNEGFGTPGQIDATGREISPWVDPYVQNAAGRREQLRQSEAGRRGWGDVSGEISGRLDEQGQNIGNAYTDQEREINDTAGRMWGRNEAANRDVVNNIAGTSGSLRGAINDTFGGLRGDNSRTFAGISGRGGTTLAEQMRNMQLIMPGGQMQAARVGRSFAPQVADVMGRMRRSGIDPNSPEAASQLAMVEAARSRAMDDASAGATESYVRQANDLQRDQRDYLTAADRERLANESGLAIGQVDRSNQVGAREGEDFRREVLRASGEATDIDRDRSLRATENLNTGFDRGRDLLNQRNNLTTWGRQAEMEDIDRRRQLVEGDDASELQSGRLMDTRFDRGTAFTGMNQSTRDQANQQLQNVGNNYRQNMFQAGNTGQGWGETASRNYGTALGYEQPNASWGTRLLGGIASAGLNMIAPGAGGFVGMIPGMGGRGGGMTNPTGAGWGGGPMGQYGGGAGPNGSFSIAPPSSWRMPSFTPQNQNYSYDPAKTRTTQSGDLQVGRYNQPTQRQGWRRAA